MKKVDILVEIAGVERVTAGDILSEKSQVEIAEEDLGEWRIGETVVAWFAVTGALAGVVSALVTVAEWARKNGGKGDLEIRECRITSKETTVITIASWSLDDSEQELTEVVKQVTNDISIRVS